MSQYIPNLAAARRAATVVGLGLLGLAALLPGAQAQSPNDVTKPTPYSWPMFHNGGTSPGALIPPMTNPPAPGVPMPIPINPSPDLLTSQLQGTASALLPYPYNNATTSVVTEVPSFLLGNFNPLAPPGPQNNALTPNNFRDALPFNILSWSSPFTFLIPAGALDDPTALQQDDTLDGTTPNPNFTAAGFGAAITDTTATNNEYVAAGVVQGAATATAKWTLTPTAAGFYSITFHIPDLPEDGSQQRVQDAHYVVASAGQTLADVHVSQTDANSAEFLAGPFFLAASQPVTVTLDNTTSETPGTKVVVADSVALQPGFGADVQSSPTAINATEYPEIKDALYYGVAAGANANLTTTPTAASAPDPNPRGNTTIGGAPADALHSIRQLVYYGRSENIILQDAAGKLVDDAGNAVTTPVVRTVGAIYCVDGFTGGVVWRYQTPAVQTVNADGSLRTFAPSAPVFSSPAVARINVAIEDPTTGKITYATKLVVIVGDDNGLVYCLDAVGNRNGTSNSDAVVAATAQPVFSPKSGLGDVKGSAISPLAHVGTTPVYWIYRPDPANPIRDGAVETTSDPTRDLPVPEAFGTASPTVYVNPLLSFSPNAVGAPPGDVGSTTKPTSNATIYLGNSNGTLYSLDGLGGLNAAGANFNVPRPIAELGPLGDAAGSPNVPTCGVNWWFAVNGTATNTNDDNNTTIVSAPAIWATNVRGVSPATTGNTTTTPASPYHIYFTTANDTQNEGRVYSLLSTGPADNTTGVAFTPVGGANYNVNAEPDWAFPQVEHQVQPLPFPAGKTRPPLGSMSGSPVVFLNPHDLSTVTTTSVEPTIYVAAASGIEAPGADRPGVEETGRIWAIKAAEGSANWAYPSANDPNDPAQDTVVQPSAPLGTFRHVTPAIGLVQFPSKILFANNQAYTHTDSQGTFTADGSTTGPIVPMLYAGSAGTGAGQLGPRFYGIDLDGRNDIERTVFKDVVNPAPADPNDPLNYVPGIASPGDAFQTSPVLLVNSSAPTAPTLPGNGGALFVGAGSTLYQISATPVTNRDTTSTQVIVPTLSLDAGFGQITTPSVAAADVADLEIPANSVPFVTDWVYFGDRGLGVTFGITPKNQGSGGTNDIGNALTNGIVPPTTVRPRPVLQQFPLYTYLFDGTTDHPGGTNVPAGTTKDPQDMRNANPIGGNLPVFEWGQNVYIRIGNVIPPFPILDAGGNLNPHVVPDPDSAGSTDPDNSPVVYADGGPVTIQISEYDPTTSRQTNQTDTGQVPRTVLTALPGNGFIARTDPYTDGHFIHTNERLIDQGGPGATPDPAPTGWIAAYTYAIRDGSGRKNTPGSMRRVINAIQTAKAYQLVTATDPVSGVTTTTPQFLQTVTLTTTITQGNEATVTNAAGQRTVASIAPVDQPTFALLNPLAAHGGGVPIIGPNNGAVTQIDDVVGPFAGVHPPGSATMDDLTAYTNGNRTYQSPADIPKSGVLAAGVVNPRLRYYRVTTALGEINHGTTGDNAAPNPPPTGPTGTINQGTGGLASVNAFGQYMLNIGDRSVLGLANQVLHVTMESHNAHWNDNTGNGGPGAVVNPLPWEQMPASYGPNSTPDYPNIPASNVTQVVQPNDPNNAAGIGGSATNQAVIPDPAVGTLADLTNRVVKADPVQLKVIVPRYQPANLQLYDAVQGGIGPNRANTADNTYPMGYVSRRERVYVDSNHNGRYDDGEAYRYINAYVGVPVDMNTTIETSTVDLGKLPQSLGVQTDAFAPPLGLLGPFMPYRTPAQASANLPGFANFFKPVTIYNRGNVNLLNVHLDQKIVAPGISGNTLPIVSDALDSQALIPAYDYNGALTGPRSANLEPFLLRSSLDTDLVTLYGRNPGIVNYFGALYPSATFHKAQVGAAQPTQLTVPDVPNNNGADARFALTPDTDGVPPGINGGALVNAAGQRTTSVPYIGLAVPLGTPVGTYSQRVQLFEGIDQGGYRDIGQGGTYTPLLPPQYGGQSITLVNGGSAPGSLGDTWYANVVRTGSTPTVVKATVVETRMTDNTSFGTLPQVDTGLSQQVLPVGGGPPTYRAASDFQPSAFRNIFWNGGSVNSSDPQFGALSLAWTTSRGFTSAATPPYNIAGAVLPFTGGYFNSTQGVNGDNNTLRWWKFPALANQGLLFTNTVAPPNGVNTGMTFAPDQQLPDGSGKFTSDGSVYAFVQNTVSVPGGGNQNQILCYPVINGIVNTTGSAILVTRDPGPAKSGVRGLKFTKTFTDPFSPPGTIIKNNLWAFWSGGARNRSAISFSSADTTANGGPVFGPSAVLPIPAGLTSVSDPCATLISIPQGATTTPIPAIEVTYTGISPDGNADIYVSRYQPYFVRDAQNNPTSQVGLALVPSPLMNEQLLADPGNLYWQARDVGWLRTGAIQVNLSLIGVTTGAYASGAYNNVLLNKTPTFDRATNTLAYTNLNLPDAAGNPKLGTVYVDLARGRVRFSPALPNNAAVYATFYPQARRITTDPRADTVPVAFLDPTYKPNEAPGGSRVQTDRYWYIWRKSGSSGTSTTPTLYYKTQRLTLVLHDNANKPVGLQMSSTTGLPTNLTITDVASGTAIANTDVDIDWVRGRIYFPMVLNGQATEGRTYKVAFTASDGTSYTPAPDTLTWLDEPRNNDLQNQAGGGGPVGAAATSETAIPIDTITNESNVSAFLDPLAYGNVAGGAYDLGGNLGANANQPHKIWLFWNSTRNGTADIYYETIEPKFSAVPGT